MSEEIKMCQCVFCGEEIVFDKYMWSKIDRICDKPECSKEQRDYFKEQEENARYEAEQDGYGRYK